MPFINWYAMKHLAFKSQDIPRMTTYLQPANPFL